MNDVYIYAIPLPTKVRGMTIVRMDCTVVFVNAYLTRELQEKAVKHELRHVACNHVYDMRGIKQLEEEAG